MARGRHEVKDDLDFDGLALIAGGHTAFQLLWAGVQLGVFALLSKQPGLSRVEITGKIGIQEQPAKILLTGLAALRLVVKEGDAYRNAGIVEELLSPDSPGNMIDVLGWQHHIVYPAEFDFVDSLKQNRNVGLRYFSGDEDNLYSRLARDPHLEKVFHDAMASLSHSANAILAAQGDLSGIRHLVDAGGGNGENVITLARANPHLRLTVFDAPTVCARARENIDRAGLADRIGTHPGNFFVDPFPPDIDAILFAHMLTIWSMERNTALLRRAYEALPTGGQVIIFNMMGNDEETGPMTAALGSPYFLCIATGQGMLYPAKDFERMVADAGFKQTRRLTLPRDHVVLIGVK